MKNRELPKLPELTDEKRAWYILQGYKIKENILIRTWYLNNRPHRHDGPAIEWTTGDKEWWLNGNRHREDGPAVEFADGDKEWYLNNTEISEEEHRIAVQKMRAEQNVT